MEFPDFLSKQTVFEVLQSAVYETAVSHGWWEGEVNIPEKLALIHSEVSEALEEYRNGGVDAGTVYSAFGKPEGFGVELADTVIRIMDLCEHLNIDLAGLIVEKHEYNLTREWRHGGKLA